MRELVPGETVLVHGAAGNVGSYAVQFAQLAGARVVATASAQDIDKVQALGAEKVIDFRAQRFEEELKDVDVVIDTVGGGVQRRSFAVLKPGGRLISAVSKPNAQEAERRSVHAGFMLVDVTTPALAKIASLVDEGKLSVFGRQGPAARPASRRTRDDGRDATEASRQDRAAKPKPYL